MSLLTKDGRLSVKPFAVVPALLDLPEIHRQPASVSNVSSRSSVSGGVDLEEGCLITKSVKYTHQVAYLVNVVRSGDPVPIVSETFQEDSPPNAETSRYRRSLLFSWASYRTLSSPLSTRVTSFSVSLKVVHRRDSADLEQSKDLSIRH